VLHQPLEHLTQLYPLGRIRPPRGRFCIHGMKNLPRPQKSGQSAQPQPVLLPQDEHV
jgi:hypothetical protein